MTHNWTDEQYEFVRRIEKLWASGQTQVQIAEAFQRPLPTLRSQLLNLGVKFGRAGRLLWVASGQPIGDHAGSANGPAEAAV